SARTARNRRCPSGWSARAALSHSFLSSGGPLTDTPFLPSGHVSRLPTDFTAVRARFVEENRFAGRAVSDSSPSEGTPLGRVLMPEVRRVALAFGRLTA